MLRNTVAIRLEILNVRVERDIKQKLERLVRRKAFRNQSEAVRRMLEEHLREHLALFASDQLGELVKEAAKISDSEFDKLAAKVFRGPRTAAEIVAEGRGR